jgi:chemotaxis protein MotA
VSTLKIDSLSSTKKKFDFTLIFGLSSAFLLIFGALLIGGSIASFYNVPAVLIVMFGTISVTMVSFNFKEIKRTLIHASEIFYSKPYSKTNAISDVISLAQLGKDRGILALDELNETLADSPFLQKSIALVVDGNDSIVLENTLTNEILSIAEQKQKSVAVLKKAAEIAPSMGLIGTLVGLIQLLGNLDSPAQIGPAMAVALLTTFYGAVLAYMVFAPISAKLENHFRKQIIVLDIYLAGAISISKQENVHSLKTYLGVKSYLKS